MISAGSRPSRAASISPRSSRSSGSMNGEVEEGVRGGLVGKGPQVGGLALERLPVVVDPDEPLLGQAPAAVAGDAAQRDVVVRGPGEVDEVRAGLAGRHDHQVHLRAAQQLDRGLRVPGAQHPLDDAEPGEPRDDGVGVVGLDEQVEVADRLAPPAQRARLDDPPNPGRALELRDEVVGDRLRAIEQQPLRPRLELLDALEDPLLGARGDALEAAQAPRLGGLPQVLERLDPEALVDDPHRLRPDARDPQQVDEAGRDLGAQTLVGRHVAGRGELDDLVADGLADARDRPPLPRRVRRRDVERRPGDGVGGAVVGDRLELDLALDLEDVAHLVEDPGEVAVGRRAPAGLGQVGIVGVEEVDVDGLVDGIGGHARMVRAAPAARAG